MSGTFTMPPQASGNVGNPPVGYYRYFIGDGTDNTTGVFYRKDSAGAVTPLVPASYTDEQAQDAVASMLNGDGTITLAYNDPANTYAVTRAAITGDVSIPGGSNTSTIGAQKVTNAMLTQMAAMTVKGNNGGTAGSPGDLTAAQIRTMLAMSSGDISDFAEAAQDAIGLLLIDSPTIDVTYNDAGNTETFQVVTTGLDLATQALRGLLAPGDKRHLDNFFDSTIFNVKDWGITNGNSAVAAANVTAWNALMAVIPDNATVFFPPSAYQYFFASTLAIPAGKHLTIAGAGNQKSIITTTSASADVFSCADWYQTFDGLKFTSSVTRTGGAAINSGNNVAVNVLNCDFAGLWDGIFYTGGTSAGNLATVFNCNFSAMLSRAIIIDGRDANTIISNVVVDGASGVCQAGLALLQCGSVIVSQSDFIRSVNNLLLAPTGALGVFSAYFVNVFFDTSPASSVKFAGTGNIQRIKFVNCWFSGSATGCEFASTATTLPTAIDFVGCDIFGNSSRGLYANGVQDFSATNCRIAGNSVAGVECNASAAAVTKVNLQNNRIGPCAGFGANGQGVVLNAGTYGGIYISGNDVTGNTSNLNIVDNSSVATTDLKQIVNNLGRVLQGLISSFMAPVATVGTTESLLHATRIPANAVLVGQTFRVRMVGISSSTGTLTFRVRAGALGTVAGDTSVAWTSILSGAQAVNQRAGIDVLVQVRSIGAAGTIVGEGNGFAQAALLPTAVAAIATPAVNTTNPWFIDITAACSVGTFTAQVVSVEAL